MNLSKIYRGVDTNDLREFQFRSFGETEPGSPLENDGFVKSSAIATSVVASTSTSSANVVEEAYARGRREGLDSAEDNLETSAQALAAAAEEISRLRESLAKNSGQDMLRLVMAVSAQIIHREVSADPKIILTIIETALQSSVRADQYRIRLNPADLENVTQQKPLFLASISGLKNLSIETDASISPGGCRVDSDLGDVDATIETQLEAIRQALSEAITDVE
ncbi:MAG: flagellar assembly protein FliH [Desulfuromusa sp.]|nr:flagellar assembly protein FliH [Desulfuromusa sp.]